MNNLLIRKYSSFKDHNFFLQKIRFYSLQRVMIRYLANAFVPMWFVLFSGMKLKKNKRDRQIIVSLTTFPARINRIWIVIECMLRQSYPPDKIILWLSKDQFNETSKIPNNLLRLQKKGLEIEICDGDLRSHKKYYYALKKYPDDIIITVDDDFIYSSVLIEELMGLHSENPDAICCNRAVRMEVNNKEVAPYNKWEYVYGGSEPEFNLFFTSGGGTLFPPKSLHDEVLKKDVFMEKCKYADDVWLNMMAQMKGTKILKTSSQYEISIPLFYSDNITLASHNVDAGFNDEQLKNVRSYYIEQKNIDPLRNLINE